MKKWFFFLLGAVLVTVPHIGRCSEQYGSKPDATQYLPGRTALAGWHASGGPQIARGEDLYLLIDGGAEIFLEYGFEQAVMQTYVNKSAKTINLEIYKMKDSSGAYGIYTFRTSERGKEISIGDGGRMEDYYVNFWKGNVLVTVIGFDTDEETTSGVETIAKTVADRINKAGRKPPLTGMLPAKDLIPNCIKYVRGNLALYNHYEIDKTNIFGLSEGAIGMYPDYKIILFLYNNETECRTWFQSGMDHLRTSPHFHDLTQYENGYTMKDKNGDHLHIEPYRNFIIFMLGTEKNTKNLMAEQKTIIDHFMED